MIKIVTMTGADESVTPKQLLEISQQSPFVEWAILVSRNSTGNRSRFPGMEWIKELTPFSDVLNLSLHLCGSYVNDLLLGDVSFVVNELSEIWDSFGRVQINTHGVAHEYNARKLVEALDCFRDKEFIFQYDNMNDGPLNACIKAGVNCSALFDLSHGAGIAPEAWPEMLAGVKCGYAGGIGPHNAGYHIKEVSKISKDQETWIDMETHIRSLDDSVFDLGKVENVLRRFVNYKSDNHERY